MNILEILGLIFVLFNKKEEREIKLINLHPRLLAHNCIVKHDVDLHKRYVGLHTASQKMRAAGKHILQFPENRNPEDINYFLSVAHATQVEENIIYTDLSTRLN